MKNLKKNKSDKNNSKLVLEVSTMLMFFLKEYKISTSVSDFSLLRQNTINNIKNSGINLDNPDYDYLRMYSINHEINNFYKIK